MQETRRASGLIRTALVAGVAVILASAQAYATPETGGRAIPRPPGPLTVSGLVTPSCALTLSPGGNFAFGAIAGLGGNAAEATSKNVADVNCFNTHSATLAITDASLTNSTTYDLLDGTNKVGYEICATASNHSCYTNSTTGFSIAPVSATPMYGFLGTQGAHAPGAYSDTVTVTLTFS